MSITSTASPSVCTSSSACHSGTDLPSEATLDPWLDDRFPDYDTEPVRGVLRHLKGPHQSSVVNCIRTTRFQSILNQYLWQWWSIQPSSKRKEPFAHR